MTASKQPFRVRTLGLDLPAVAGAFGRRLHDAGLPVSAERAALFTRALTAVEPVSRRRLYWTARGVFVSDRMQVPAFDAVFRDVFGSGDAEPDEPAIEGEPSQAAPDEARRTASGDGDTPPRSGTPSPSAATQPAGAVHDVPVPVLASDEEVLRSKRFDALSADELARLYRLMTHIRVATPLRRTRRAERQRHGERIDMRRTLRGSLRTGGDPMRLARRRRRTVPRRLVMLCDISGSMEP
ncbi:MAG: VWA domain-containing protein, partial [Chloroflexi bacterium]|nr:VWA domain-containing protein [Chloroflexota bacterium]